MRKPVAVAAFVAAVSWGTCLCGGRQARAGEPAPEETPAEAPIVSVKLFKNGLAVVRREATLRGPHTYRVDDAPEPVHGTFWIESSAKVDSRVAMREVETPLPAGAGVDFQKALVGRRVTVTLRNADLPAVKGTVEAVTRPEEEKAWSRAYQQPQYGYRNWFEGQRSRPQPQRFLVVRTDAGTAYVDSSMIACLQVEGGVKAGTTKERKPVLLLTVGGTDRNDADVAITYLARGMSWAPSYRIDIAAPRTLVIEQKAVVKNELADLDGAEVHLISGFPNVKFAHVTSPLSTRTTWAQFFQQLNQRFRSGQGVYGQVTQQRAVAMNVVDNLAGLDLSAIPTGEGVDLHYQTIGRRTIAAGESLSVSVAQARARYERIVEWIVPDTRTANGRLVQEHERRQNPDKYEDPVWDALRFRNPFTFPMTTAAAMIVTGDEFSGQCMSCWVNPGEQTVLHVTKALSVRARAVEHEVESEREYVHVGGYRHRRTPVEGELRVNNHRKERIDLVIRRRFSGELLEADGSPKRTLREEGVWSVNKRNELTWTIKLGAGEEKNLVYRYSVLVRH